MTRAALSASVVALGLLSLRCSAGNSWPGAIGSTSGHDAGNTYPATDAGNPSNAGDSAPGSASDASAGTSDAEAGPVQTDVELGIPVIEVADTPCVAMGGTSAPVIASGAGPTQPFRSLQRVSTGWAADTVGGASFATFNEDGSNVAIGTAPAPGVIATSGGSFDFAGVANQGIELLTYQATGTEQGSPIMLGQEYPTDMALASGAGGVLAAWGASTGLRGRGTQGTSAAGSAPFDLALTTLTGELTVSAIADGNGFFAFAFSGDNGGGGGSETYQTVFGRATSTARSGDPVALFTGSTHREVVQLANTGSGYVLLLSVGKPALGGPSPFAAMAFFDVSGNVSHIERLDGTSSALGLAVQGSEIGVVALRTDLAEGGTVDYVPEFRPFDATGSPIGAWVCLDVETATTAVGAVLAPYGTGYASLVSSTDGAVSLERFDHLGTGSP
jgi:hypothetical protein